MTAQGQTLRFEAGNWQSAAIDISASAPGDVLIESTAALIPANVHDGAFWVGHLPEQPAAWVGGWGPLANRVVCRRDALVKLSASDAQAGLGLLALAVIHTALRPLLPVERIGLLGEGAAASLVRAYLVQRGIALTPDPARQSLDLLIDVTGDIALWGPALATVATEGAALLMGAARRRSSDYNFYTDMHRRSLKVISHGWHTSIESTATRDLAALTAPVAGIVRDKRWVQPLSTKLGGAHETAAWRLVDWTSTS